MEESQTKMEATNKETRLWKQRVADLQEELQLLKEQLSQHFIDLADSDMIIMPRAEFEELEELHTRELSRLQNEYAHELAELRRKVHRVARAGFYDILLSRISLI